MPGAAAAICVLLMLPACSESGGGRSDRPSEAVPIRAETVPFEREAVRVEVLGTARARQQAIIYPKDAGEVTEVGFTAGVRVAKGDVLLKLDDQDQRLAQRLAEVRLKEAEQLLARFRRLEGTGAVSATQIDEATTALEAARISLDQAKLALEDRTVRAPFSGFVGLSDIDAGTRITTQTAITRLDDRSVLLIDFEAPEQVFGNVSLGQSVRLTPFSAVTETVEAEIAALDSRVSMDNRSFTVRVALDNAQDRFRPGMSFRVRFESPGQAYASIPEAAILWGSDGSYVWAVREGKARQVPVTIVARVKARVLVTGDIPEGSQIIARGVQKVRDGTPVTDIGTAPAAEPPTPGGTR